MAVIYPNRDLGNYIRMRTWGGYTITAATTTTTNTTVTITYSSFQSWTACNIYVPEIQHKAVGCLLLMGNLPQTKTKTLF